MSDTEPISETQLGFAIGAVLTIALLAVWLWISTDLVARGRQDELLILVSTFSLAWISVKTFGEEIVRSDSIRAWMENSDWIRTEDNNDA